MRAYIRQLIDANPPVYDAFHKMAEGINRLGMEFRETLRGNRCGSRNHPEPQVADRATQVAHRRNWRRCKRSFTQVKGHKVARGKTGESYWYV